MWNMPNQQRAVNHIEDILHTAILQYIAILHTCIHKWYILLIVWWDLRPLLWPQPILRPSHCRSLNSLDSSGLVKGPMEQWYPRMKLIDSRWVSKMIKVFCFSQKRLRRVPLRKALSSKTAEVMAVLKECHQRLPKFCWSDVCLQRVSSKSVIKDCYSSAEVMAVYIECHQRLLKCCWSDGCL